MPPTLARASLRVLLVEDNTTDALVACDELAHAVDVAFTVESATRLQAALALLARSAFDVVLLDLSLPDCDGLDTFLQLRAAAPEVPVVVLSHRTDEALALQAVHAGAQDYLVKGCAEGLLVRAIRYAIERASAALALRSSELRLAGVVESAMDAIISVDASQRIVLFNAAAERMFGYAAAAVMGQGLERLLPLEFRARHQGHIDTFAGTGMSARTMGQFGQLNALRANGEEFPIEASISKTRVDGQVLFTVILRDVTESKLARMALEAANRDLERSNAALQHVAHYDALTGLPNRVLLGERLVDAMARCQIPGQDQSQSQNQSPMLAVAFLDIDAFKPINDAHGHEAGDALLVAVAQRLKAALREGDWLARIGGDEFVAVLQGLHRAQDCEPLLAELLSAVADPVMLAGAPTQVTASIGVTLYPADGEDADRLIRHADQAMYLAKQAGRNRYQRFNAAQASADQTLHEGLSRMRKALGQQELVLYYQPKVNMRSGEVTGAEALIRWQHPERGLLPPGAFLPMIENHALSVAVGEWVIASALAQMAAWQAAGLHLAVSVNIGSLQLQQPGFVAGLGALLARHAGLPPRCLEMEILETSALQDIAQVSDVMQACQALGVRFALDDFGTGYSSLAYLKRLPAEQIKIDQSFVRDMLVDEEDLAIVKGVIGLAQAFGREVIAEGVETIAHGTLLLGLGCELAQGYGIARPMPAQELPGWVARWRPDAAWTDGAGAAVQTAGVVTVAKTEPTGG